MKSYQWLLQLLFGAMFAGWWNGGGQGRGRFAGAPFIFGLGIAPWGALSMAWAFGIISLFPWYPPSFGWRMLKNWRI